jgi:hypothetical protein
MLGYKAADVVGHASPAGLTRRNSSTALSPGSGAGADCAWLEARFKAAYGL